MRVRPKCDVDTAIHCIPKSKACERSCAGQFAPVGYRDNGYLTGRSGCDPITCHANDRSRSSGGLDFMARVTEVAELGDSGEVAVLLQVKKEMIGHAESSQLG